MKILLALFLFIFPFSLVNASTEYEQFMDGAMSVYSQFKKPSKEESEKFYGFLQSKWTKTSCKENCDVLGYLAGTEYAKERNVEIKKKR